MQRWIIQGMDLSKLYALTFPKCGTGGKMHMGNGNDQSVLRVYEFAKMKPIKLHDQLKEKNVWLGV